MDFTPQLRHDSDIPLYRQIFVQIAARIRSGELPTGERLPATRELAGLLGLNRTTDLRGLRNARNRGPDHRPGGPRQLRHRRRGASLRALASIGAAAAGTRRDRPRCGSQPRHRCPARPSALPRPGLRATCFPWTNFAPVARRCWRGRSGRHFAIGSPGGYEPLRRYLLEEARRQGLAGPNDDLLITNGCQQALDLIGRVLLSPGDTVAVEDPGLPRPEEPAGRHGRATGGSSGGRRRDGSAGAGPRAAARAAAAAGGDAEFSESHRRHAAAGGASRPARCRARGRRSGGGERSLRRTALRGRGRRRPSSSWIDRRRHGAAAQLFQNQLSRVCGWAGWWVPSRCSTACARPRRRPTCIATSFRRRCCWNSPNPAAWRRICARMLEAGAERLRATLAACRDLCRPARAGLSPEGGMNLWVRLPEPLDAAAPAAARAEGRRQFICRRVISRCRGTTRAGCG